MILVVDFPVYGRRSYGLSWLLHVLLLWILLTAVAGCSDPEPLRLSGTTMGTGYSVVIPRLPSGVKEQSVHQGIESILQGVNQKMSTYIPESELSRINRSESGDWMVLSPELFDIIRLSHSISEQTDGAFDITVGPLVNLWGFGPDGPKSLDGPSDPEIALAKSLTGYQNLEFSPVEKAIRKKMPGLYIDLSSIAKGYGVDAVADYLDSLGVPDYLVEIGGEIRGKGLSHRGDQWRIAVEKPVPGQRQVQRAITFSDIAIATSGDYRNYYEHEGMRYSHTIDPRNGRPINHTLASVTVLSDRAVRADAWATALMVLGEKEGYRLAEKKGLAAYFLYKEGDDFLPRETTAFSALTTQSG